MNPVSYTHLDVYKRQQIGGSLVKGIGGLLNTVSFGGFNKLFGIGGNAKEVQSSLFPPLAAVVAVAPIEGRLWHIGKLSLFARGSPR